MSIIKTGNVAHDSACAASEGVRQVAVAAAGATQATVRAAEITHFRTCLASAKANGVQGGVFIEALQELGTGGA